MTDLIAFFALWTVAGLGLYLGLCWALDGWLKQTKPQPTRTEFGEEEVAAMKKAQAHGRAKLRELQAFLAKSRGEVVDAEARWVDEPKQIEGPKA